MRFTMKGLMKLAVLILLIIVCTQTVTAMTVSSITVDPSGSLTPSTPVSVTFKIQASSFPSGGEIQLYTSLDNATWTYTLLVNDIENLRPVSGGHNLAISGFELAYKMSDDVAVRINLAGNAPSVTQTTDSTILRVTEYDANDRAVTSSQVVQNATIVNTADITSSISSTETALADYRTHIDEKAALNIDTSAAEAKYTEAQQKIASASARATSEYTEVNSDLTDAKTAIDDGETALDKAWAEYEVAAAQVPINNVDAIIAWFKGNTSTANDQQLSTIITMREVAVSYISNANDAITSGNYAQARQKAQDAFAKGNESYTDALARQKELSSGWSLPFPKIGGSTFIIIGIVVVILVIVGVIIYRKRSQWDELG